MKFKKIVILTGAGISAESGIKTFRDSNGLWENHSIEEVATYRGYMRNPSLVHEFYNQRRRQLLSHEVSSNPAHIALAKLEEEFNGDFCLVTQNIDDLHERAGNTPLHMHGEILKVRCEKTGKIFEVKEDVTPETLCKCCLQKGNLRPQVVWFGEMPFLMDEIQQELETCDLFMAIGTSGQVYPAAGFVQIAKQNPDCLAIEVNADETEISSHFDIHIVGKAGDKLPKLVDAILQEKKLHDLNL